MRRSWILRAFAAAAVASCGGDTPTEPPPAPVPTQLSVATQPGTTVINGAALNPQPVVRLRDAGGLPVAQAGVTVVAALVGPGAVLGGTASVTTNSSGLAVFAGLTLTGAVGPYTLRFTSAGLTSADANAITLTPGPPVALAITAQPSPAAQAGTALAQQPQVQLRDQSGNAATVANVTVTASLVTGTATVSNASAVTSAAGVATFAGLALAGPVGTYTLRFTAPGLTAADAAAATVLAAGAPTQLAVVTQPSATIVNGGTLATQPVIELRDAYGNASPQAGVTVTATLTVPGTPPTRTLSGTKTAGTDAAGRAAFTDLAVTGAAGPFTLSFAAPALSPAVSNAISLTAGAATRLGITTAPPGVATNGSPMTTVPVVQVQDASGNAVATAGPVTITAATLPGGPVLANATAATDATGKATFTGLTLTGLSSSYFLTFSATGLAPDTAATPTFLQAGAATKLAIVVQPSGSAANGAALTVQPVVRLQDASGNNTPTSGVTVTASLVSGSATLTSATATTQATGIATFSGLTLTGPTATYTLRFSATGVTGVDAVPTVLTPGAASGLALTVEPSAAAQSGVMLVTQPVVQLRDVSGNAVPQAGVTVTAAVATGTATLTNATATTNAAGTATFAGLTLSGMPGANALQFSAPSLAGVNAAAPVNLAAGPAVSVMLTTQPATAAQSGVALTVQPVVQLRDGTGNPVPQGGVTVTTSVVVGGVVLQNAATTTDAMGTATFAGLAMSGPVGSYTLRFTATGVGSVDALAPTALSAGPAAAVTLSVQPATAAQSGIALTQQPVVQLRDAAGNAVALGGQTVTASLVSGSLTLAGATAATDATGAASFGGLTLTGTVGNYTLRFTVVGVGSVDASAATALSPGTATQLALQVQPPATAVNAAALVPQPAVRVLDGAGNVVTSSAAVVTASTGAGVSLAGAGATAASGVATFSGLTLTGTVGSYTLSFASPGLAGVSASAPTVLGVGPAASVTFTQTASAAGQSGIVLAQQPAVRVQDVSGNVIAGATVIVTADNGGAVLNGTVTTDVAGIAAFTTMALAGAAGPYTLTFTAGAAATTTGLTLSAGAAAAVTIAQQPSFTAASGVALSTQPVVHVEDGSANPVVGAVVTASLTAPGATVGSATAVTDGAGNAAFSGLFLMGPVGSHTLQFAASGVPPVAASAPTVLGSGPAARLELTTQPSTTAQVGSALASQPVVRITDASGNAVSQSGTVVTANVVGGGVALANATATSASGLATFAGLRLTGTVGSYTLRFTAPGLDSVDAAAPTVLLAGTATHLSLTTQPASSAPSGVALATQPVSQLRDVGGNAVALAGVAVTASVVGGGALVSGATVMTAASGAATFTGLTISGPAGSHTLRFSASGLDSVDAASATVLTAGVPAQLVIVTPPPASAVNGVPLSPVPVIEVHDAAGNPVAGVALTAATGGGAALTSATAMSAANGQATFAGLTLTGSVAPYTLQFCVGPCVSATIGVSAPQPTTLQPGAPATLTVTTAPSTAAQSGIALASQPVVVATDVSGNPVPGATVTATAGAATVSGGSAVTNASGVATFTALTVAGPPAGYTLQLASGAAATSSSLALSVGPAASVTFAQAPSGSGQNGVVIATQPAVLVEDATGNPIPGLIVTVTASGGATVLNGTATTNGSGVATFTSLAVGGAVGAYTLTYTAGAASTTSALALAAGTANSVIVFQQPSFTATNGAALAVQPIVLVTDGTNPLPGVVVTASLTTAGAILGSPTAITGANGQAVFSGLVLAGTVGSYTLRFTVSGLNPVQASSATVLNPGPAAKLALTTQPSTTQSNGLPMASQPVVQITDAGGNAVSQSGTVVTASVIGGGPAVSNAMATTSGGGVATFGGLALTGTVGSYALRFTAPGLDSVDAAAPTALQPGPAAQLALAVQPAVSAVNAVALAPQPVVEVLDVSGNLVTTASAMITAGTTAGATLANATATASGGIATFSGLTLTGQAGNYLLSFATAGVTGVSAAAATALGAGAATQLTLTTQPSVTAQSGIALAPQPVVQLRDVTGNPVAQSGVVVTATVVGGGVSLDGDSATSSPTGVATFAGLKLSGPVGAYTLRFSAPGVSSADAAAATALGPGAPATLVIVTPPPASAVNGVSLSPVPVIEVRDAAGNPVPDSTLTVSASGNVVLSAASAVAGANGRATFTGLTLTGAVAGYNLQFCLGPCATATVKLGAPQPIALQAGAPATLTVTTAPSTASQSGIALTSQPVVVVKDASLNPVPGATVTATAGAATVTGGTAVANTSGVATFTALTVSGSPVGYTLQLAAGAATSSSPLALGVGPASLVTFTQTPSAAGQNGVVLGTQPVVLVTDATGNPIPGLVVTVTADAGAAVSNGTATTGASGIATFTSLAVSGTVGSYTLTYTAGPASTTSGLALAVGTATDVTVSQEPSTTATNGAALVTQPIVYVTDGLNALQGVVVTASLTSAGAAVSNATAITDASGNATFSGLSLFGVVNSYTLRFTVSGVLPVDAAVPTALAAGPAAALVLTTAPSASATNDVTVATQPVVQVVDAGGNAVPQSGTPVNASLTSGALVLAGAGVTTDPSGVATFLALKATGTAGAYTLRFSAAGLDSVEVPLTLLPGAATALELVTQPGFSTPAGVVLAQTPVARLRDVSGNTVPQAGRNVTVRSSDSTATFLGTVTVPTDAAGLAAFADIGISGPRGRHLLRFTGSSLATAVAADTTIVARSLALSVPVSDSAGFDQERPYVVDILPGDTLVTVQITGGQGTADLIVRFGAAPDIFDGQFDCYPRLAGNEETCVFRNPAPGQWYITLLAFPFSFSNVTLLVNSYP